MPAKYTQTVVLGIPERLYNEFRDAYGELTDVVNPRIDIFDPSGDAIVSSASPTQESTGVYYYTLTLSTAVTNKQGISQVWWRGSLGGATISADEPRYILVRQMPYFVGVGGDIVDDVRRFVGDDDPSNYKISQVDLHYYISDGVDYIQRSHNLGYTVTISPTSITFNADLTPLARELFKRGAALVILEHVRNHGLWGVGSLDIGDIKINLSNINKERSNAIKELKAELTEQISLLRMSYISGATIDSYAE